MILTLSLSHTHTRTHTNTYSVFLSLYLSLTNTAISDLTSEMNDQHYHVQAVKSLMLSIKDTFFAHVGNHGSVSIVDTMLQHCMLERVLLSPVDAVYCTQFALLFNELDVSLLSSHLLPPLF